MVKVQFTAQTLPNKTVIVNFNSAKECNSFQQNWQYEGGFKRFEFNILSIDKKYSIHSVRSDEGFFKALMMVLYKEEYEWVFYIFHENKGYWGYSEQSEYPHNTKFLSLQLRNK